MKWGPRPARPRSARQSSICFAAHHPSIWDRLTALIKDTAPFAMKGFKESLLTKVLCIVDPEKYLTILMYTGMAGKREIARSLWGLELPAPEKVNWTIGRLILWSSDLLIALLGEGFRH